MSTPIVSLPLPGYLQGLPATAFAGVVPGPAPGRLRPDYRQQNPTTGTISDNNRVMLKTDPNAPELPFVGARVRLHRLADGYLAWQGQSDAQGYYWPTGLEVGVAYYPVAIDLTGAHECDAAGPVVATQAI